MGEDSRSDVYQRDKEQNKDINKRREKSLRENKVIGEVETEKK